MNDKMREYWNFETVSKYMGAEANHSVKVSAETIYKIK